MNEFDDRKFLYYHQCKEVYQIAAAGVWTSSTSVVTTQLRFSAVVLFDWVVFLV